MVTVTHPGHPHVPAPSAGPSAKNRHCRSRGPAVKEPSVVKLVPPSSAALVTCGLVLGATVPAHAADRETGPTKDRQSS